MAKKAKKQNFPKQILVYQIDIVEGEPVYAVTTNVDMIEADMHGERVAVYYLNKDYLFKVRRELA